MKQIIVGTAGHIDHGKTSLVRALTGIDTDRLKEEKERGITIDLGFAHLPLENGIQLGIVDVPGHERFVKNMLAGVGGIDLVLLVIAADEGVMPQTREHLAICELLQVKDGLVALTKIDMVEEEWLELVTEDLQGSLKGTFLEGRPIVPVSSRTGEGLDHLRRELMALASAVAPKSSQGPFRLPIDRVFIIQGFGTVVTGTLFSGSVKLESPVMVYPQGQQARVRSIQVYGRSVSEALAGQRTAINLQGLGKEEVARGDVLSLPGGLLSAYMLDVSFELLADAPRTLKDRSRVRFHHGTSEVLGRIHFLEVDELLPGEKAYAQLRLEGPVVALPKDRYVIRSYSPVQTIGGGEVLEVAPQKLKKARKDIRQHFEVLEQGSEVEVVAHQLQEAGVNGLKLADLIPRSPLPVDRLKAICQQMVPEGRAVTIQDEGGWLVHADQYARLREGIVNHLKAFHARFPLKGGIPKEELKSKSSRVEEKVFARALKDLERDGRIVVQAEKVRQAEHSVQVGGRLGQMKTQIEEEYLAGGAQPPDLEKVWEKVKAQKPEEKQLIHVLLEESRLVRIKGDLFYHREPLTQIEEGLKGFLRENGEITPGQFKDLFQISRKYAIPLLEYFDSQRLTIRLGDRRVLR